MYLFSNDYYDPDNGYLPKKFHPFLLGHSSFKFNNEINLRSVEKECKKLTKIKDHILSSDNYIFKSARTDTATTPDTHLYRVLKAEKISKFVSINQLENEFIVPKKYIYWKKEEKKFYVLSQKIELTNEVATPSTAQIESELKARAVDLGGQTLAFANGAQRRMLTTSQARTLADLSFSTGYNDLNYNNLYFTKAGQVAIIDTEPLGRFIKKRHISIFSSIIDKEAISNILAVSGIMKLKMYTSDLSLKEVEKIESTKVLEFIAKSIGKIAISTIFILATYFFTIKAKNEVANKIARIFIYFATLKTVSLMMGAYKVYRAWCYSCQEKGIEGFLKIGNLIPR